MSATLRELADLFGCELHGDADRVVTRVGTLSGAGDDAIAFLANPLYREQLPHTRAAAVILDPRYRAESKVSCLLTKEPYLAFARIAALLHPPGVTVPGVDASAVVASGVHVPKSAQIASHVTIGPGCSLGESVVIGPGSVLGADVTIGSGLAALGPSHGARRRADRRALHRASRGCDRRRRLRLCSQPRRMGEGAADRQCRDRQRRGNGANTTIDRGTIDDTVIEDGVKLDNLVQIAHNVRLGEHTIMAAMSGVAGSTKVGKRCMIGGGVVMINQLTICDDVLFTFRSVVTRSVTVPGTYSGSLPAEEAALWRRNAARFKSLDALADRLRAVERRLKSRHSEQEKHLTMSDEMPLDIKAILERLPHRYPFLMVDRVLSVTPGKSIVAVKNVTANEAYFVGHFPGHPVMPGVLVLEALAQAGGVLAWESVSEDDRIWILYLVGIDNARFKQPVRPGDQSCSRSTWCSAGAISGASRRARKSTASSSPKPSFCWRTARSLDRSTSHSRERRSHRRRRVRGALHGHRRRRIDRER